jgi:hypothetical protein
MELEHKKEPMAFFTHASSWFFRSTCTSLHSSPLHVLTLFILSHLFHTWSFFSFINFSHLLNFLSHIIFLFILHREMSSHCKSFTKIQMKVKINGVRT